MKKWIIIAACLLPMWAMAQEEMEEVNRIKADRDTYLYGEGYGETGWEYERAIYLGYQRGDREAEESDICVNDDIVDSDNILSDLGNYTGYLYSSLINIFDNDRPVEDSTTINKKPKKERKNTLPDGPVMGGL